MGRSKGNYPKQKTIALYQIEIKELAITMMQTAYSWYEQQQKNLGESFLHELDNAFEKISTHPEYFSTIAKSYRKIKLKRFPYIVIYELLNQTIVIYAIFHTAQDASHYSK